MKTLKESILADMNDQIEQGEVVANNINKLNTLIPLILDKQSSHYVSYTRGVWKDYSKSDISNNSCYKEFTKNYNSGVDEIKHEGQRSWEKLFEIAKKELNEITFNDMNKKYKTHKTFIVFNKSTNNNEFTGFAEYLNIVFYEKDYTTGRLKWRKMNIVFDPFNHKYGSKIIQSIANIKSTLGYTSNYWERFIFDVDSNPNWAGITDELCKALNIEKLTAR